MATIAALEAIVVNVSPKTNWTFIAVTTADGATGWGECSLNGWETLLVAQAQLLARVAVGRRFDAMGDCIRYLPHAPGGLVTHAVKSAVEQALVDLAAQAEGRSVAAHLGAKSATTPRSGVTAYANINRGVRERSSEGFADAARRAVAAGYRAVKLAPFSGVIAEDAATTPIAARIAAGVDHVFAVREAVGEGVAVMVDCHWRFDAQRAEQLLRDLAPCRPYWVECMLSEHPAHWSDIARLTELAHDYGTRTAGGELVAGADTARAMCDANLYSVLMPDIKYAGGYRGMLAVADVCAQHDVAYAPHNPTGPIAHVASVHVSAVTPTLLWLEHQWNETPLFDSLAEGELPVLREGAFVVPTGPGLGATLARSVAAANPGRLLPDDANLDPRLG